MADGPSRVLVADLKQHASPSQQVLGGVLQGLTASCWPRRLARCLH